MQINAKLNHCSLTYSPIKSKTQFLLKDSEPKYKTENAINQGRTIIDQEWLGQNFEKKKCYGLGNIDYFVVQIITKSQNNHDN